MGTQRKDNEIPRKLYFFQEPIVCQCIVFYRDDGKIDTSNSLINCRRVETAGEFSLRSIMLITLVYYTYCIRLMSDAIIFALRVTA